MASMSDALEILPRRKYMEFFDNRLRIHRAGKIAKVKIELEQLKAQKQTPEVQKRIRKLTCSLAKMEESQRIASEKLTTPKPSTTKVSNTTLSVNVKGKQKIEANSEQNLKSKNQKTGK